MDEIPLSTPKRLVFEAFELMRRYQRQPESQLASAVGTRIRALCRHPDWHPDPEVRCRLYRLAMYWECLALLGEE